MVKVLVSKQWVGKVIISHTTSELSVFILKKKKNGRFPNPNIGHYRFWKYIKCVLLPLTWIVGPIMNLINETHYLCEINVLSEYSIITRTIEGVNARLSVEPLSFIQSQHFGAIKMIYSFFLLFFKNCMHFNAMYCLHCRILLNVWLLQFLNKVKELCTHFS